MKGSVVGCAVHLLQQHPHSEGLKPMLLRGCMVGSPSDLDKLLQHGVCRPPQHGMQLQQGARVQTDTSSQTSLQAACANGCECRAALSIPTGFAAKHWQYQLPPTFVDIMLQSCIISALLRLSTRG